VAKEKGQTLLEDEVVEVPNVKEQGIHKEDPRPRTVEPYRPPVPFPQRLAKAKLEAKFGKFLEILKKCKSTSLSWMPSPKCPLMLSSLNKFYLTNGGFKNILWFHSRRSVVRSFKKTSLQSLKIRVVFLYLVRLQISISSALCDI